jgi:hypothetical protein
MAISFDGNVNIVVSFAADAERFDGFGTVVALIAHDPSSPILDGDRYRVYTSASQIAADLALATPELTAGIAAQITTAFAQDRAPSRIILAQYEAGGSPEVPSDAIDALDADGVAYYGVALLTDSATDAADLATKIAARRGGTDPKYAIGAATLSGAAMLDGSIVEASGALEDHAAATDFCVQYHDGTGTGAALGFARLVARLGYDPDLGTAGFEGVVRGIEAYATDPTPTQRLAMEGADIELYGQFGGQPYVSPGVSLSGRPLAEQVSIDWFAIRFAEDLRQLKLRRDAAGKQIPLSAEGQEYIQSVFAKRLAIGEAAGKFDPGVSELNLPDPIPASDITAERFSGDGTLALLRGGRIFSLTFTASA